MNTLKKYIELILFIWMITEKEESKMAALYLIFSLAFAAILFKQRKLAMGIALVGLLLTLLMFSHHATDILKINW